MVGVALGAPVHANATFEFGGRGPGRRGGQNTIQPRCLTGVGGKAAASSGPIRRARWSRCSGAAVARGTVPGCSRHYAGPPIISDEPSAAVTPLVGACSPPPRDRAAGPPAARRSADRTSTRSLDETLSDSNAPPAAVPGVVDYRWAGHINDRFGQTGGRTRACAHRSGAGGALRIGARWSGRGDEFLD